MKYQSSQTKLIYDIDFDTTRKKRYICPECTPNRKKKTQKDLEYYPNTNTGYCFHCEAAFFEYTPYEKQKEYLVPEWRNKTELTDKAVKWFEGRMISQSTLIKMKVFSDREYMPQFNKEVEVICFPFFIKDKQVNIKFRGAKKSFKLVPGAELIWYNFNALNEDEIIICEGEIDALTWVENGFDNVISVPNGANKNLEYLDGSIKYFEDKKKVYLATDNDTKGIELKDELIRRLGAEKCYLLNFKQYKDSNEYFINEGGIELKKLIDNAKPVPIKGVVKIDYLYNDIVDLYENGVQRGLSIDNDDIDQFITWELGRLAIVTGVPGCFYKNQLIHTSQGVKPISEIKKDEYVLSYNHLRKQNEYRKVLKIHKHKKHNDKLYKIKMKDGTIIKVTENHKFFNGVEYVKIKNYLLSLENNNNKNNNNNYGK